MLSISKHQASLATVWTKALLGAASAILLAGCGIAVGDPAPGNDTRLGGEPADEDFVCLALPHARCEELALQARSDDAGHSASVVLVTVRCSRSQGCTHESGSGEARLDRDDGSHTTISWAYETGAVRPNTELPRLARETDVVCVALPMSVCDAQVEATLRSEDGSRPAIAKILVSCTPGVRCTVTEAEGVAEILREDGSRTRFHWALASP